ncbi:MAG: glycosyltransferase family 10 [Patescibacteria group bacterium]|nr:glycosyltransferase family 10 [Patescibacteria group bacterium]
MRAYLIPFSEVSLENRFFNPQAGEEVSTPIMAYAREYLHTQGIELNTADYADIHDMRSDDVLIVFDHPPLGFWNYFYKIWNMVKRRPKPKLRFEALLDAFPHKILFAWESPVNKPWMFQYGKYLKKRYDAVYSIPNFEGYRTFFSPQRNKEVAENEFSHENDKFLVMMNSFRRAKGFLNKELYRERSRIVKYFAQYGEIDLYGEFWKGYPDADIQSVYRGYVADKFETLGSYRFAICFENAVWPGYLTEKLFECMFTGTIPIYLGDPEIVAKIPENCFIDMRKFRNYGELREFLHALTREDCVRYRDAMRVFLESPRFRPFTKEYFAETLFRAITDPTSKPIPTAICANFYKTKKRR